MFLQILHSSHLDSSGAQMGVPWPLRDGAATEGHAPAGEEQAASLPPLALCHRLTACAGHLLKY